MANFEVSTEAGDLLERRRRYAVVGAIVACSMAKSTGF